MSSFKYVYGFYAAVNLRYLNRDPAKVLNFFICTHKKLATNES